MRTNSTSTLSDKNLDIKWAVPFYAIELHTCIHGKGMTDIHTCSLVSPLCELSSCESRPKAVSGNLMKWPSHFVLEVCNQTDGRYLANSLSSL